MKSKWLKIAKQIYADIAQVNNKQYQNAMYNYYDNKDFVDFTLQSGNQAEFMFKRMYPGATTHTLTNGNTFMKYIDTSEKIILLALLSKNGKLDRQDLIDGKKMLDFLLAQLRKGKTIQTSCNKKSLPLLNRLKRMDSNVKVRQIMPQMDIMGQGTWAMYEAYI